MDSKRKARADLNKAGQHYQNGGQTWSGELDIWFWNFYKAKKKYRLQDETAMTDGNTSGGFILRAGNSMSR